MAKEEPTEFRTAVHFAHGHESRYANHVSMFRGGMTGRDPEFIMTFWQIPLPVASAGQEIVDATLLGSYVMQLPLAEQVIQDLAKHLGYTLSKEDEENGDR